MAELKSELEGVGGSGMEGEKGQEERRKGGRVGRLGRKVGGKGREEGKGGGNSEAFSPRNSTGHEAATEHVTEASPSPWRPCPLSAGMRFESLCRRSVNRTRI